MAACLNNPAPSKTEPLEILHFPNAERQAFVEESIRFNSF
jgi:hypothetical protein